MQHAENIYFFLSLNCNMQHAENIIQLYSNHPKLYYYSTLVWLTVD